MASADIRLPAQRLSGVLAQGNDLTGGILGAHECVKDYKTISKQRVILQGGALFTTENNQDSCESIRFIQEKKHLRQPNISDV